MTNSSETQALNLVPMVVEPVELSVPVTSVSLSICAPASSSVMVVDVVPPLNVVLD